MMFAMFGAMFFFTHRQMKKQQEGEQKERQVKEEAFNPYKEAKRTGKSVQEVIAAHEKELLEYATTEMEKIPNMKIYGTAPEKSGVISFLIGNEHHYDMGMLLDKLGIEVRTGHHCAQPLMQALKIDGTVRASFAIYNTKEDVDAFISALRRVAAMLG